MDQGIELSDRTDCAIIIQARMSSARFPGKMKYLLAGVSLLEYMYRRCKSSSVKTIAIATSDDVSDNCISEWCNSNQIRVIRGSLNNVISRYIKTGEYLKVKYIIRVCGDSPFVAVNYMDLFLRQLIAERLDFVSFLSKACIPGFYSEAVSLSVLKKIESITTVDDDLEHVTKYIIEHPELFKTKFIHSDLNPLFAQGLKLTIDYPQDLLVAEKILATMPDKFLYTPEDVLAAIRRLNF
ncbi:MAG: hypothetical protein PHI07_00385 [Candidatus Omnitrophica bacterium]|jgi:spore coat polysaccharide biosynthesis protein SpsF|nr:hypothetical protein [Candidatus Omnitrophota bacterium]